MSEDKDINQLILNCPLGQELTSCIYNFIREMDTLKHKEFVENMPKILNDELNRRHRFCYNQRCSTIIPDVCINTN